MKTYYETKLVMKVVFYIEEADTSVVELINRIAQYCDVSLISSNVLYYLSIRLITKEIYNSNYYDILITTSLNLFLNSDIRADRVYIWDVNNTTKQYPHNSKYLLRNIRYNNVITHNISSTIEKSIHINPYVIKTKPVTKKQHKFVTDNIMILNYWNYIKAYIPEAELYIVGNNNDTLYIKDVYYVNTTLSRELSSAEYYISINPGLNILLEAMNANCLILTSETNNASINKLLKGITVNFESEDVNLSILKALVKVINRKDEFKEDYKEYIRNNTNIVQEWLSLLNINTKYITSNSSLVLSKKGLICSKTFIDDTLLDIVPIDTDISSYYFCIVNTNQDTLPDEILECIKYGVTCIYIGKSLYTKYLNSIIYCELEELHALITKLTPNDYNEDVIYDNIRLNNYKYKVLDTDIPLFIHGNYSKAVEVYRNIEFTMVNKLKFSIEDISKFKSISSIIISDDISTKDIYYIMHMVLLLEKEDSDLFILDTDDVLSYTINEEVKVLELADVIFLSDSSYIISKVGVSKIRELYNTHGFTTNFKEFIQGHDKVLDIIYKQLTMQNLAF